MNEQALQLDTCIAMALNPDGTAAASIDHLELEPSQCIKTWALKTKTAFHDHPDFYLPWYFGVLCFSFSLGGLFMLVTKKPDYLRKSAPLFPYHAFAYLLIFLQGPLSFMADYVKMDQDSIFHLLDRFLAMPLTLLQFVNLLITLSSTEQTLPVSIMHIIAFSFALFSFYMSQIAQSTQNLEGFIFWHNLWHTYPIIQMIVMCYERKLFIFKMKGISLKVDEEEEHVLLSDLTLRKVEAKQ